MPKSVYLDYAATTPLDTRVLDEMLPYLVEEFYNPSANYLKAKNVADAINLARKKVANILVVKPTEIIFTAGGTEANNLAIKGVMDYFPDSNLIISAMEHPSVADPAKSYDNQIIEVDQNGFVDLELLEKSINDKTVLVSIMYANNEIGVIQNLVKIKHIIENIRKMRMKDNNKLPIYFHTDACQAVNYLSLNADGLGVDLMTLNGSKIYGPKQSGALFIKRTVKIVPQILGGGQEFGIRSGTENVANIIGLSSALEITTKIKKDESDRLTLLRDYFIEELNTRFLNCSINGTLKNRLPNNINVSFSGIDNEVLLYKLDLAGIMCATGSACSAQKNTISPTLLAIGLTEAEALSSIRFSLGRQTTKNDIDFTLGTIQKIVDDFA
jgi:cysteine desulfurase